MVMKEKVVLAYSGGLDTSVIIPWLKENYNCEVIAVCCNAGQKEDFDAIEKKSCAYGGRQSTDPGISGRNSLQTISGPPLRQGPYMKMNICLELPWQDLLWHKNWWRQPRQRVPIIYVTAAPVKEMIRCVLKPPSKPLTRP